MIEWDSAKDENYRFFEQKLDAAISGYGYPAKLIDGKAEDRALLLRQREQFKRLTSDELKFREWLLASNAACEVYAAFISEIRDRRRSIIACRPYFRERQTVCVGPITDAMKLRAPEALYPFHFNSNFVRFVLRIHAWPQLHPLRVVAERIRATRQELFETNMPLAISQARAFWNKAPKRTSDWRNVPLDYVQIASEGLLAAIDKFVMPPPEVLSGDSDADLERFRNWRAVAIGRMLGNFIEFFSSTLVHYYPDDRRKIYRANKHVRRFGGAVDYDELAELVNADLASSGIQTSGSELRLLMASAVHPTEGTPGADGKTVLEKAVAAECWRPDSATEQSLMSEAVAAERRALNVADLKLLRLHGIDPDTFFSEE